MPVYLDCNATTPIEPEVLEAVIRYLRDDFGNAGSRTHEYGLACKKAVERARDAVAAVVDCDPQEVIFTSGATESNNIALLGLAEFGRRSGCRHIISTAIEHKAVLEPLEHLVSAGFEVTLVPCSPSGRVAASDVGAALRSDTLLVSVMHVNNETGVIQPIEEIARTLTGSEAWFHVDAAQSFGKEMPALWNRRIDLISVSGHKIFAPKGVGALIARRRGAARPPLQPLLFGGGQERGLRPGTAPVPLIAGLGEAARLAIRDHAERRERCLKIQQDFRNALRSIEHDINGADPWIIPSTLNVSFKGIDSEAAIVALKDLVAISNGSACTSASYKPSHVIQAMNRSDDHLTSALRFSWCHLTTEVAWRPIINRLAELA